MKMDRECVDLPEQKKKRSLLLLILFISLLVHFLGLLIFLRFPIKKHVHILAKLFEQKFEQKKDRLAALKKFHEALQAEGQARLKMRKSTFGTHVYFEEPPKVMTPAEIPHHLDHDPFEKVEQGEDEQDEVVKKSYAEKKIIKDSIVASEKPISSESKIAENKAHATKLKNKQESPIQEQVATKTVIQDKLISDSREKTIVQKAATVKEIKEKPVALDMKFESQMTQVIENDESLKKKPQKKKNILTMTKGFIDSLGRGSDDGNSFFDRAGDENKQPSFEDLKFISYQQKIYWQLQSAWNRRFRNSFHKPIPNETSATLDYSIDANGKLLHVEVVGSSGDKEIDSMLAETMRLASPFPPIPKHLNIKVYRCVGRFSIVNQYNSFGHR